MSEHCGTTITATLDGVARVALVGSPNAGKTTLFNALTGLRAKTGNYPGVTVARYEGRVETDKGSVVVEDLPGTYSLDPISPDEEIVAQVVENSEDLDGILVVLDSTNLIGARPRPRGAGPAGGETRRHRPDVRRRAVASWRQARPGRSVARAGAEGAVRHCRMRSPRRRGPDRHHGRSGQLDRAPSRFPTATDGRRMAQSVAKAAHYTPLQPDSLTGKLDAVLLHPWDTYHCCGLGF